MLIYCISDSASTVVLGGRAFIDTYDNKEKKSSGRFYSFITNSSRLYSFIDDMLDDDAVDIDDVGMDDSLLQQLPDTVLVQVEGMTGGWHPSHDDDSFIDDSAHNKLGDALFSIGPVTITDIRRAEVSTMHTIKTILQRFSFNILLFDDRLSSSVEASVVGKVH